MTSAKLAETPNFFTERFVFKSNVGNKDGRIGLIEHGGGKLSHYDRIDSDKDGVVTVAEMKAAGVIKK